MRNLNDHQFPVYEVGDPSQHDTSQFAPNYHLTAYHIGRDSVRPEHFGIKQKSGPSGQDFELYNPPVHRDVPLSQVRVAQPYVFKRHVENLATVPGHAFQVTQEYDPVTGHEKHDGTVVIEHGTHRTAAAKLRGDETIRVRLSGKYHSR